MNVQCNKCQKVYVTDSLGYEFVNIDGNSNVQQIVNSCPDPECGGVVNEVLVFNQEN